MYTSELLLDGKDNKINYSSEILNKTGELKSIGGNSRTTFIATDILKDFSGEPYDELDIIGTPNLLDVLEASTGKQLKTEVIDVISQANPEHIVFLIGADYIHQSYKFDKDYYFKPHKLIGKIKQLRQSVKFFLDNPDKHLKKIYVGCLRPERRTDNGKTLPELFTKCETASGKIKEDLITISKSEYFSFKDITENLSLLETYLGVNDEVDCYAAYKDEIGEKEFLFKNKVYQNKDGEVKYIKHAHADMFIALKDKFVQITEKNLAGDIRVVDMDAYGVDGLRRKYGKEFIQTIPYYDGLTLEPDNTKDYKRTIFYKKGRINYKYYNLYEKVPVLPTNLATWEDCPNILNYLYHIAQGEATVDNPIIGDRFTMLLDWLIIAFRYPKQRLPMIVLLNEDRGTGKSTLLDFYQYLMGSNALKSSMEDLLGRFNSHNVFKTWMLLEEVKMEGDKEVHMNTLKAMVTDRTRLAEPKGLPKFQISNYTRFIAASNFEHNIFKIDNELEDRFFMLKPPQLKANQKDPKLLNKMKEEAPAFLRCLADAEIQHQEEDRLWFRGDLIRTREFYNVFEHSKPWIEKELEDYMKDIFFDYKLEMIRIHPEIIAECMKGKTSYYHSPRNLKEVFKRRGFKKYESSASTIMIPTGWKLSDAGEYELEYFQERQKSNGKFVLPKKRYFITYAHEWLNSQELESFKKAKTEKVSFDDTESLHELADKFVITDENREEVTTQIINKLPVKIEWENLKVLHRQFRVKLANPIEFEPFIELLDIYKFSKKAKLKLEVDIHRNSYILTNREQLSMG